MDNGSQIGTSAPYGDVIEIKRNKKDKEKL